MISVREALRTWCTASVSLFESPLCFSWGFHYYSSCVHSGLLKGFTESIVPISFWWEMLLLNSFLFHFSQSRLSLFPPTLIPPSFIPSSLSRLLFLHCFCVPPHPPQVTSSRAAQQQQSQSGAGSGKNSPFLFFHSLLSFLSKRYFQYNKFIWHSKDTPWIHRDDIWRHW